jgi:hypothetical protein
MWARSLSAPARDGAEEGEEEWGERDRDDDTAFDANWCGVCAERADGLRAKSGRRNPGISLCPFPPCLSPTVTATTSTRTRHQQRPSPPRKEHACYVPACASLSKLAVPLSQVTRLGRETGSWEAGRSAGSGGGGVEWNVTGHAVTPIYIYGMVALPWSHWKLVARTGE